MAQRIIRAGREVSAAEAAAFDEGFNSAVAIVHDCSDKGLSLATAYKRIAALAAENSPLVRAATARYPSGGGLPPAA